MQLLSEENLNLIITLPDLKRFKLPIEKENTLKEAIFNIKKNQLICYAKEVLTLIDKLIVEDDEKKKRLLEIAILKQPATDFPLETILTFSLDQGNDPEIALQLETNEKKYLQALQILRHEYFLDKWHFNQKKKKCYQHTSETFLAKGRDGRSKYFSDNGQPSGLILKEVYEPQLFENKDFSVQAHKDIGLRLKETQCVVISLVTQKIDHPEKKDNFVISSLSPYYQTIYDAYTNRIFFEQIEKNQFDNFLKSNPNPNLINFHRQTSLLIYAVKLERANFVEYLVKNNGNVDFQDLLGNTPLHYAAKSKSKEIIRLLLRASLNANIINKQGWSAMHVAAKENNALFITLLLNHGADPNLQTTYLKFTPLHFALADKSLVASERLYNCNRINLTLKALDTFNPQEVINSDPILKEEFLFRREKSLFLEFLILLANSYSRKMLSSQFSLLPLDVICLIVSYLNFGNMNKKPMEGVLLTKFIFEKQADIKEMAKTPGGINVFQNKDFSFTFFKSPKVLANHYLLLTENSGKRKFCETEQSSQEKEESVQNELVKTIKNMAVPAFNTYYSLYQQSQNKKLCFKQIEGTELYSENAIAECINSLSSS